jgi:hypothetical protein
MPHNDPRPISLFDIAKRAADIVDPDDDDAAIGDFEAAFEDDDEPAAAIDVEERVGEVLSELDPAVANGSLSMAGALTVYLSFRRDELHASAHELIRLTVRSEWKGDPPEVVKEWLQDRGVTY